MNLCAGHGLAQRRSELAKLRKMHNVHATTQLQRSKHRATVVGE